MVKDRQIGGMCQVGRHFASFGVVLISMASGTAFASNGTQFTGYGVKAQGMGGAAIALPQDAIAAANNPAGMAFVGDRFDGGVQMLYIEAESQIGPSRFEGHQVIPVPEFGYNREISPRITLGISTSPSGALFGYSRNIITGQREEKTWGMLINSQFLPTATYRPTPNIAIGVSAAVSVQTLQLSNLPGSENHGLRFSVGAGYRLGVLWRPIPAVAVGASYASKVWMTRTSGYERDILAGVGGRVDVPEKVGAGIAISPVPKLTLAADYQHIDWRNTQFSNLFGFRNQSVKRVGVNYDVNTRWTLRAGASFAPRAPSRDFALNNILITSIDSDAVTAGLTYRLGNGSEISVAAEANMGRSLDGTGPSAGTSVRSTYVSLGLSYGRRF